MWDVDSTLFKTTASGLKYAIIKEGEGPVIGKAKTSCCSLQRVFT